MWKCNCGFTVPEPQVKLILEEMFAEITKLIKTNRYNTELWLTFLDTALSVVHPQHEVIIEIAKFLVPVLCRAPGRRTSDFPLSLVRKKLELARWYLNVTNIVDPGYSKQRVKVLYEVVETKLFLTFQEHHEIGVVREVLENSEKDLQSIIDVFDKLKPDKGFESFILKASVNLAKQCREIVDQMEKDLFSIADWREGRWGLLELCQL